MNIQTNFESSEPLCVELSIRTLDWSLDMWYPINSIIDKIFDTKWKKQCRKLMNEYKNQLPDIPSYSYDYILTSYQEGLHNINPVKT
jgi:hypothetical protein